MNLHDGLILDPYRSQKIIHAKPMTLGEYNKYKGWLTMNYENPDYPGYISVCALGEPDQHTCWVPKENFEADMMRTTNMLENDEEGTCNFGSDKGEANEQ
jgi:hypothetical protein